MPKYLPVIIIFLNLSSFVYSQNKQDYIWIFGNNYIDKHKIKGEIMEFNKKCQIDTFISYDSVSKNNASISDKDGNLLFYFNGCRVVDSTFQLMNNGDSINFGPHWPVFCNNGESLYPGAQNSIILPDPGNDDGDLNRNAYYVIHKRSELKTVPVLQIDITDLYFSYVDMNRNEGRGSVIEKNKSIFHTTKIVSGYLSACKHANGRDWWIVQMEQDTNIYFKTLLTKEGFKVDSQIISESPIFTSNSSVGQAVFSPDGKKWITNNHYEGCLIYDFNRETGELSNLVRVNPDAIGVWHGVAVSPNSRFVYLSDDYDLFQVDLWDDDIPSSLEHIAHIDSFPDYTFWSTFNFAQLAPDCKIYIVNGGTNNYLHVINKPNEKGKACDFRQHSVYLPIRNDNNCIPNFPHFRIDEDEKCDPTITSLFGEAVWYRRDLEVSPNPSSGVFTINLPAVGSGRLLILDLNGRVLFDKYVSIVLEEEYLDISKYKNGNYFLEFYPDIYMKNEHIFYGTQIVKIK